MVRDSTANEEMQEPPVQSLGQEDPLEEGMATCSSVLARESPWTEEPGGLQSPGLQRVGHSERLSDTHTDRQEVIGEWPFKLVLEGVGQALTL